MNAAQIYNIITTAYDMGIITIDADGLLETFFSTPEHIENHTRNDEAKNQPAWLIAEIVQYRLDNPVAGTSVTSAGQRLAARRFTIIGVEKYTSNSGNTTWKVYDDDDHTIYLRQANIDLLKDSGLWDKLNDLLFGKTYQVTDGYLSAVKDGDFYKPVEIDGEWVLTSELMVPQVPVPKLLTHQQNAVNWANELVSREDGFLVLDTETNDFKGFPIEIAVINQDGKVLFDKRAKLPEGETVHPNALRTHGITVDDLKDAPTFAEIADELTALLTGRVVVIYNAEFDRAVLRRAYSKIDMYSPEMATPCAMIAYAEYNGDWNDYRGNYRWVKLAEAAAALGIEAKGAHSALGDAQMTLAVVKALAAKALSGDSSPF